MLASRGQPGSVVAGDAVNALGPSYSKSRRAPRLSSVIIIFNSSKLRILSPQIRRSPSPSSWSQHSLGTFRRGVSLRGSRCRSSSGPASASRYSSRNSGRGYSNDDASPSTDQPLDGRYLTDRIRYPHRWVRQEPCCSSVTCAATRSSSKRWRWRCFSTGSASATSSSQD